MSFLDDESEFTSGLSFPTVDASESSDEEFDLHRRNEEKKREFQVCNVRREKNKARKSHFKKSIIR